MARKRPLRSPGTLVVFEHDVEGPRGQPARRPARAQARRLAAARLRRGARRAAAAAASRCSTTWSASPARASRTSTGSPSARTCPSAPRGSSTTRKMGPAIVVFPDCFTCLGGNQYVNSLGDRRLRRLPHAARSSRSSIASSARSPSREHRGCFGKSSGGYGAIIHGMKYAAALGRDRRPFGRRVLRLRLPARLAEHAERARQVPRCRSASAGAYDVRAETTAARARAAGATTAASQRFLDAVWSKDKLSTAEGPRDHESLHGGDLRPRSAGAQRLPPAVQPRDRRADRRALEALAGARPDQPGRAVRRALHSLRGIYIDCGSRDQYHIHYGTRILSKRLAQAGIRHTYEEFDDNHSDIDYRMDVSLPFLYRALKP